MGSVCGATAGCYLSEEIAERIEKENYYDKTFGNSMATDAGERAEESYEPEEPLKAAAECTLAIVAAGTVIAASGIYANLRKEPMKMLAGRQE